MAKRRQLTYRAFVYAALVHIGFLVVLGLNLDWSTAFTPSAPPAQNVMPAVAVDERAVQQELAEIRRAEEEERVRQEQAQQELEQARQQREAEEKRLAELKREQEQVQKRQQEEQQRLKEIELKRKQEEEQKQRLEEERKQAEEAKRKAEEDAKRKAEEEKKRQAEEEAKRKAEEEAKRKAEEEKKRQAEEAKRKAEEEARQKAEAALREQLAAEETARNQSLINEVGAQIQRKVQQNFTYPPGLPQGLSCTLFVRMIPGGDVAEVRVVQSSGNATFDRAAENAVRRAAPLPVPAEPGLFDKVRQIQFVFTP